MSNNRGRRSGGGGLCFAARRIVLLSLLSGAAGVASASERSDYEQAWQFFQQGRYTEAISGFKTFLSKYPKGSLAVEARFTLARIEPSGNNAFVHYQHILDNHPTHPLASQASYATAQYYQNIGATAEAKARYRATYSRYGKTSAGSESLYRLTLLSLQTDSLEAAEAYAQAFYTQYPGNPRQPAISLALADRYQSLGDTGRARATWRALLTSHPTSYEAGLARERLLASLEGEGAVPDSAVPPVSVPIPALRPASPDRSGYLLQVGAYRDRSVLDRWSKGLAAKGYRVVIDSSEIKTRGIWKLRLGPYRNREEAAAAARKLKATEELEAIIIEVR